MRQGALPLPPLPVSLSQSISKGRSLTSKTQAGACWPTSQLLPAPGDGSKAPGWQYGGVGRSPWERGARGLRAG